MALQGDLQRATQGGRASSIPHGLAILFRYVFPEILLTRHPPSPRLLFQHTIKTWPAAALGKTPKQTPLASDEFLRQQ